MINYIMHYIVTPCHIFVVGYIEKSIGAIISHGNWSMESEFWTSVTAEFLFGGLWLLWWKLLKMVGSRDDIGDLIQPIRKPTVVIGIVITFLWAFEYVRYEWVAIGLDLLVVISGGMMLVWGYRKICEMEYSSLCRGKIFVYYIFCVLQLFFLGMTVTLFVGIFGLLVKMFVGLTSHGSDDGYSGSISYGSGYARLEDGTIIEDRGSYWVDVHDSDRCFKDNYNGTFTEQID